MVDNNVMGSAFKVGSGFSMSESSGFVLTLIAFFMFVWAAVLIVGWIYGLKKATNPSQYFTNRVILLGTLIVVMSAVFYVS